MTNPWGLPPSEVRAICAIRTTGTVKGAARELGLSTKTIDEQMARTRRRMGTRSTLSAVLAFDRWEREARKAGETV